MEKKSLGWRTVVLGATGVVAFGVLWELAVLLGLIDKTFLPAPSHLFREIIEMFRSADDTLLKDILVSAQRVLIGFALSAVVGVPLGLVMGMSPVLKALLDPIISIIRPLPAMSWIPLTMLWLGIDDAQKYAIVFMGCFASVLVYTVDATMRVEPELVRAARNLGAGKWAIIRHVILPGALPNIFSGLKVVLAIAWTCVISAELVGATSGLGFRIWTAKDNFNTSLVLLGMVCISATVLILDIVFRFVERFALPWLREEVSE
ncbi:MAG: ABC transporter permease [Planctomycetota bacterium]|nr:MAG: ABC transporter permease [Planctomycetota bacterium]